MKRILIGLLALTMVCSNAYSQEGSASIHMPHGSERRTASGTTWQDDQLVAAHKHYPLGSYVRILDPKTRRSVDVEIIDRGPYVHNRVIDLSKSAAARLGLSPARGVLHVKVLQLPPAHRLQPFYN